MSGTIMLKIDNDATDRLTDCLNEAIDEVWPTQMDGPGIVPVLADTSVTVHPFMKTG